MKIWLTFPPTSLVETLPATFVLQPWPKIFRSFAIFSCHGFPFSGASRFRSLVYCWPSPRPSPICIMVAGLVAAICDHHPNRHEL